jgi:predicted O-methyltransferase YrrM
MFESTMQPETLAQIERVETLISQRDDALAVPRVSAEFLHACVLAGGYRQAVEIGTSYGWSGLWIGSAIAQNGGELITMDIDAAKVEFARDAFRTAGLAETVTVLHGKAEDLIADLDGPFDFAFLDAEKQATLGYFERIWVKLAQRATIVTDNISSHADEIDAFVQYVRSHPRLCSMLVPIGEGLELTVKLDPFVSTTSLDGADWVI